MEVLAKKTAIDGITFKTQTLQEHTEWVVYEVMNLIDSSSLDLIALKTGFVKEKIIDLIFFGAYFHDIGKATKEFQSTINSGKKSFHSLYSASVVANITDFEYQEDDLCINLLMLSVLTHHTLLPYTVLDAKCNFLDEAESFFHKYKDIYQKCLRKECKYEFSFEILEDVKFEIEAVEDDLKEVQKIEKLRYLYAYISGILNLADWLASARFSHTKPTVIFETVPNKHSFCSKLTFDKLRDFQENLSQSDTSVLVEIPTGEGKTEGSLLWTINNIKNKNSKIIYTLPTQTTSNKLYERVQNFFDKKECGLIHSSAKIYLEKKYEMENGVVDEIFKSDFLLSKSFNKPLTVSTIDSLLKYFINIGRFNIATKNFLNSVIIIDEVHSYDFKLMGFLKRFLELCNEFEVKVCLMSASIPNQIKRFLGIENYTFVTQNELFEKKANEIIKKDNLLDNELDFIKEKFESEKNILIIRNTVKSATETYKKLKNMGIENIVLYHSTFKKIDRTKKEELIFEKLKSSNLFILVATQIVEISLDIDFDIMFTDNAPIDALIQRFGRVNRKKIAEKKGEIYIYFVANPLPYREVILDLTFETIQDGYFELGEYVKWLNKVYDKLFNDDIETKNSFTRLFDDAYKKYDKTLKKLHGIEKSNDNYDLRDTDETKNDYLLYEDYTNENIDPKNYYEYTISLPYWLEKKYLHPLSPEKEAQIFYKVLKLDYTFDEGVIINDQQSIEFI